MSTRFYSISAVRAYVDSHSREALEDLVCQGGALSRSEVVFVNGCKEPDAVEREKRARKNSLLIKVVADTAMPVIPLMLRLCS